MKHADPVSNKLGSGFFTSLLQGYPRRDYCRRVGRSQLVVHVRPVMVVLDNPRLLKDGRRPGEVALFDERNPTLAMVTCGSGSWSKITGTEASTVLTTCSAPGWSRLRKNGLRPMSTVVEMYSLP